MNDKNKLHGNAARINSAKPITPEFEDYVINNYRPNRYYGVGIYGTGAYDRTYHRLDDDDDFCKQEVDSNEL